MKEMLKNAGILLAITVIAGFVLGAVYQITKGPIAEAEAAARREARLAAEIAEEEAAKEQRRQRREAIMKANADAITGEAEGKKKVYRAVRRGPKGE